jgi:hypothetical protein
MFTLHDVIKVPEIFEALTAGIFAFMLIFRKMRDQNLRRRLVRAVKTDKICNFW